MPALASPQQSALYTSVVSALVHHPFSPYVPALQHHSCHRSDKPSAAKARFRKGQGLILVGDAPAARELLLMALADLPDHPQILAAIASIETRGLCCGASGAGDGVAYAGSNSPLSQRKDVLVKHGKRQLRVSYDPALGGPSAWYTISRAFELDASKMKLLLRGTNLQPQRLVSGRFD
jgi:hypothetical protein